MNAYYKIYVDSCFGLIRSLVFKSDLIARAMNRELTDYKKTIPGDLMQWKYYMNLAGEYHQLDTPIFITSLDTGESIEFTRANLKIHKKTYNVYINRQSFLDALLEKYPKQSVLIKGILRPIDKATAIAAAEGTILYYDPKYVEAQETNLILQLEQFIKGFLSRYVMESYLLTDNLYPAAVLGTLATTLVKVVGSLRNKAQRTAEAHSFHITQYLASHNRMAEFIPYMTYNQKIWLYMNIAYIERHGGFQHTFDLLIKNLLTARNIPVYKYILQQKDMDVANGVLTPEPVFVRDAVNFNTDALASTVEELSLLTVLNKESSEAVDNAKNLSTYMTETEDLGSYSGVSKLPTKIVEAAAVDPEDINPIKLLDTVIAHWAYFAVKGLYSATADVINPITGDNMKLNMSDLFALFIYAHMEGVYEFGMTKLPVFPALGVAKLRYLTEKEYRYQLPDDPFGVFDADIEMFDKTTFILEQAILDSDDFLNVADTINTRKRLRHQYSNSSHRFSQNAARRLMYRQSYADIRCTFTSPYYSNYEEFFTYIGLDTSLMYNDTWVDLATTCLDAASNFSSRTTMSISEIQAALVKAIKRVSSYSIQFIEEMASSDSTAGNPLVVIADQTLETSKGASTVNVPAVTSILQKKTAVGSLVTRPLFAEIKDFRDVVKHVANVDISVSAKLSNKNASVLSVILPTVTITHAANRGDSTYAILRQGNYDLYKYLVI